MLINACFGYPDSADVLEDFPVVLHLVGGQIDPPSNRATLHRNSCSWLMKDSIMMKCVSTKQVGGQLVVVKNSTSGK